MSSDKYIHTEVENKIYSYWEKNNLFKPKKNKKQFSIVIPPPNVTGSLHMGHALNNSIQDLLTRFHRMNNFETLWQPGTDHAGIATQAVVERNLLTKNIRGPQRPHLPHCILCVSTLLNSNPQPPLTWRFNALITTVRPWLRI